MVKRNPFLFFPENSYEKQGCQYTDDNGKCHTEIDVEALQKCAENIAFRSAVNPSDAFRSGLFRDRPVQRKRFSVTVMILPHIKVKQIVGDHLSGVGQNCFECSAHAVAVAETADADGKKRN